jgi:transposase-like protein
MDKKTAEAIVNDRRISGASYRTLAKKYGIEHTQIYRLVKSKQKKDKKPAAITETVSEEEPAVADEVTALREELRKARLKIELQDLMIDISSKELGIDLRKKHGTRRSK